MLPRLRGWICLGQTGARYLSAWASTVGCKDGMTQLYCAPPYAAAVCGFGSDVVEWLEGWRGVDDDEMAGASIYILAPHGLSCFPAECMSYRSCRKHRPAPKAV